MLLSRVFAPLTVSLLVLGSPLEARTITGRTDVAYSPLPAAREGRYPLLIPEYRGQVKQLLLIDNRRLILAVYDVPEVVAPTPDPTLCRSVATSRLKIVEAEESVE